jgi:hypothetical protein
MSSTRTVRDAIRRRPFLFLLVGGISLTGPSACRREEGFVQETVIHAPAARPRALPAVADGQPLPPGHPAVGDAAAGQGGAPSNGAAPGAPGGMVGDVPPPPPVEKGAGLRWTLPDGWTESRTGGMRYATLKPAGDAKVDVSVVVLGGAAGGELSNVNRWRGQLGLAPVDEAGLAPLRKRVATKAGDVSLFNFESEGTAKSRMLVAYLFVEGSSWFVKMTGESSAVGDHADAFAKLVASLGLE